MHFSKLSLISLYLLISVSLAAPLPTGDGANDESLAIGSVTAGAAAQARRRLTQPVPGAPGSGPAVQLGQPIKKPPAGGSTPPPSAGTVKTQVMPPKGPSAGPFKTQVMPPKGPSSGPFRTQVMPPKEPPSGPFRTQVMPPTEHSSGPFKTQVMPPSTLPREPSPEPVLRPLTPAPRGSAARGPPRKPPGPWRRPQRRPHNAAVLWKPKPQKGRRVGYMSHR